MLISKFLNIFLHVKLKSSVNLQSLLFMNTPRFGQTPISTSNILMEDLNNLNTTNPSIAAALAFHSNLDPVLGVNSPQKLIAAGSLLATPYKHQQSGLNVAASTASPITNAFYGNFPIQALLMITRLNKILLVKRDLVKKLSQLNADAERIKVCNF